jgi:hypothetical protein
MRAVLAAALSAALSGLVALCAARASAGPLAQVGGDLPKLPPTTLQAPAVPAEFLTEQHGWITVVYPPPLYDVAQRLVHEGDVARASFGAMLGTPVLEAIEVRIARTQEELAALSPREAPPPTSAWGAPYGPLHLVVVAKPPTETPQPAAIDDARSAEEIFRHALAHVALFDATAGRPLPRWLDEGFAVEANGERAFSRWKWLWRADVNGPWLSIAQLDAFPDEPTLARVADAESADVVRFLSRDEEHTRFTGFLSRIRAGSPLDRAAAEAYGADLSALEHAWREDVARRCVTTPLVVAGALGWTVAATAIVVAWRRRKRAKELQRRAMLRETPKLASPGDGKLVVVEEGDGHVVYMVERARVPTVEHEGKMHTLH